MQLKVIICSDCIFFYFAKLQRLCVCAQWLSYKSIDETTVFFYNLGWPALRWFD